MCFNNNNKSLMYRQNRAIHWLLLLLKHILIFYKIDRSTSNFESFLDSPINSFFTSMKDVF